MISKELLSVVLVTPVDFIYDHVQEGMAGYYCKDSKFQEEINIYELAHKCKEWALTQDFSIKTTYDFTHTCFASVYGLQRGAYYNIQSDTEPEAIFKACQWILDNEK